MLLADILFQFYIPDSTTRFDTVVKIMTVLGHPQRPKVALAASKQEMTLSETLCIVCILCRAGIRWRTGRETRVPAATTLPVLRL